MGEEIEYIKSLVGGLFGCTAYLLIVALVIALFFALIGGGLALSIGVFDWVLEAMRGG